MTTRTKHQKANIESLEKSAGRAAEKIAGNKSVKLIGQYDADGISATSIMLGFLREHGIETEYRIVKQLYEEDIEEISGNNKDLTIFVDVGSGQAEAISKELEQEDTVVIDHHEPESQENFTHVNPHFHGLDGGSEISASGTAFKVVEQSQIEHEKFLAKALVGATGDVQRKEEGFKGVNKQIKQEAVEKGKIEAKKGLDLYGRTTKPLHKSLMYTSDPYLEGITDNESGAVQFLQNSGIEVKNSNGFRKLEDLSESEEKLLINSLITEGYDIENIVRDVYLLDNGLSLDEFSTVVNACGRMGMARKGVDLLMDFERSTVDKILRKYGRRISSALRTVEEKDGIEIEKTNSIGVIRGGDQINDEFIGIVTGICLGDGALGEKEVGIGFSNAEDGMVKVSARASNKAIDKGIDLGQIISEVCAEMSEEGGGHDAAAGAKLEAKNVEEFQDNITSEIERAMKA